jgi:hypothetical protein
MTRAGKILALLAGLLATGACDQYGNADLNGDMAGDIAGTALMGVAAFGAGTPL